MINPFISNADNNYLFRKNYQIISKPTTQSTAYDVSTDKLEYLQNRNPFKVSSPSPSNLPTNNVSSRSLSNSRVGLKGFNNNSQSRTLLTKNGLLEQADGWKRQLEMQERQRLQVYGAEGLRYNAYANYENKFESKQQLRNPDQNTLPKDQHQTKSNFRNTRTNQYYAAYQKPRQSKRSYGQFGPGSQYNLRNEKPVKNVFLNSNNNKKDKQHFEDQINELDNYKIDKKQFNNPHQHGINQISQQSSRQSNLVDMFASLDKMKQSQHFHTYNSYYGGQAESLIESKQLKQSIKSKGPKKFRDSYQAGIESEPIIANSITIGGKIYYKIDLLTLF